MLRISTLTKSLNLFGAGKHGFRNGDMATNTEPTDFDADWCNGVQEEIANFIEHYGITLNPASHTQLLEAFKYGIDIESGNYVLDTGVANAYVVAIDPAITVYTKGMTVRFRFANTNTGASTLDAGAGALPLVNDVGGALVGGDAPAGGIATATYDDVLNKFLLNSLVPSQALSQSAADARYAPILLGCHTGDVIVTTGTTASPGTIKGNGAALSRATYANLWTFAQASGNLAATEGAKQAGQYGPGDGATTFTIPDFRGEFMRGFDDGRGIDSGRVFGSWQVDDFKSHFHIQQVQGALSAGTNAVGASGAAITNGNNTASTGGAETRPRNVALLFCIKF